MESEIIAQEYSLTWKDHTQHVRESFTKLLQNNDFCDVTLYAEGQKIGAHKAFLTTCSEYFNKLFEDFKEERPIVVLKGIQFNILQHILKFIYNGEVSIDIDKLTEFLEAAEFLKIFGLIKGKTFKKPSYCMGETENSCNTDEFLPCKCGETEVLTQDLSASESKLQPQGDTKEIGSDKKQNSSDDKKKVCSKKKKEAVQRMYRIDILSSKNIVNETVDEEAKNTSDDNVSNEEVHNSQSSLKNLLTASDAKPIESQEIRNSTKEKRRSQRLSSKQKEVFSTKPKIDIETRRTSEEKRNSSQESTLSNQGNDNTSELTNDSRRGSDQDEIRSSSRASDVLKFGYHPGVINKKLIEEAKKSMNADDLELELNNMSDRLNKDYKQALGSIDEEDYNCDMCNKMYRQKEDYTNETTQLTCVICGLAVQLKSQMESHLKNHGIL